MLFSILLKIFKVASIIGIVLFLFIGITSYIKESKFIQNSSRANGIVIDFYVVHSTGPRRWITTCPVVSFVSQKNENVTFNSGVCDNFKRKPYNINQQITVLYDPQNPKNARIDNIRDSHGGSLGCMVMIIISSLVLILLPLFKKFEIKLNSTKINKAK